jgi:hypothetical protein
VSGEPRLSIVLNLMADGATFRREAANIAGAGMKVGPLVRDGDRLGEPFFPRIHPALTPQELGLDDRC